VNQPPDSSPAPPADRDAGSASRKGSAIVATLILISLVLYLVGDRLTPSTSQARIQAFVVPVAAEAAGKVVKVHIRDNDAVVAGQPLFDIDVVPYEIAQQSAEAAYALALDSAEASHAGVDGARASLKVAEANREMAERDAERQERLYAEDPGAISVRRLEIAQATREEARSKVRASEADLRMALEAAGEIGEANAQVKGARAALDKAMLDLRNTRVLAPAGGTVTDLRTDVGHFVQAGAPVMTLVADRDLWISADMTENNLGHIDIGDEAAIVLDVLPGHVLKGRVRSIGRGVDSGQQSQSGSLPTVQNDRDWLRQAQRIPVSIEFDADSNPSLAGAHVGGQAEVLVYAGDNPLMNVLGAIYIRVSSWLSYLY
jgi:multidrug resistance efflux pump